MSEVNQGEGEGKAENNGAPQNQQSHEKAEGAATTAASGSEAVPLAGLYVLKVGMSAVFGDEGERIPVTVLKYEPMVVSQLKTKEKDGYNSVQVAFLPDRASQARASIKKHLASAGFENGAKFIREVRLKEIPQGLSVGQRISINSLKKGDVVKVTGESRGRGFQGAVRRWNFNGGPASHGSGFHRKPGSVGNRTWPGRVMPGKRMAGRWGGETATISNLRIVDVIPEENVVLVRGAVPGHRNTLLRLMKV